MVEKKYMIVGAAAAGLVLAYMVYRGAGAVGLAMSEAAQSVNPMNNDNVINRGVTSVYQGLTGSTGSIGTDIFDVVNGGGFDPTDQNNYVNQAATSVYQGVTGSDGSIGTDLYDGVQNIKQWWSNW